MVGGTDFASHRQRSETTRQYKTPQENNGIPPTNPRANARFAEVEMSLMPSFLTSRKNSIKFWRTSQAHRHFQLNDLGETTLQG